MNGTCDFACSGGYQRVGSQCVAVDAGSDAGSDAGPILSATTLLNIDFGGTTTQEIGGAAARVNASDAWNAVGTDFNADYTVTGLVWSDGSGAAGLSMRVNNLAGIWGFTSAIGDKMYDSLLYSWSGTTASLTFEGLPAGTYDFIPYGHSAEDNANSGFTVTVHATSSTSALTTSPTKYTTVASDWNASSWIVGAQFVILDGIVVATGQTVILTISNGSQGTGNAGCVINGLQISRH
jgi:hypothetical protein